MTPDAPDMRQSARRRYRIPWFVSFAGAAVLVIAGAVAVDRVLEDGNPDYAYDDPDFHTLEAIAQSPDPRRADFSVLNGGDWRALCLIGHDGDLARALSKGAIEPALSEQIRRAFETDAIDLDGTEFALLYVTGQGGVRRLRHPHGFAFARAGGAACIPREEPVVALPVGL